MKVGDVLCLKPKMGIIPEVTKQNYESVAKQLREPIINSLDADAQNVSITVQPDGKYTNLIISDDGIGMDEAVFKTEYLALGGSTKYDDQDQIGKIGIGFLACAPLCEIIEVHSRFKGSNVAYVTKLIVERLMNKVHRYEGIESFEVGKVIEVYEDADSLGLDKHYTRIVLKRLTEEFIDLLNDQDRFHQLKEELRKILPLKFPEKCELFNHISPDLKELLLKVSNPWKINIFLNGDELTKRVYGEKEEERFSVVMELKNEKAVKGSGIVTGYFIESYKRIKDWNGLITRFQNTTIEDRGFLGWNKRPAALPKITGEIFLDELDKNSAINITRDGFQEGYSDYYYLRNHIYKKLDVFTSDTYRRSYKASAINKEIKKKKAIKKNLTKVSKAISAPKKKPRKIQKKIVKKPIVKKEATNLEEIKIEAKFGDVEVKIVKELPDKSKKGKGYTIEWKGDDGTIPVVLIKEDLVRETGEELKIDNKLYKVFFIEDESDLIPCKIDTENYEVIFNLLHPALKNRNEKIISFLFLLTYFYDKSKDKAEYRKKIIDSLSAIGD